MGGGGVAYVRVWVGGPQVGYQIFSMFCSVFVLLLIVLSWLVHDCCVCFIVPFLLNFLWSL